VQHPPHGGPPLAGGTDQRPVEGRGDLRRFERDGQVCGEDAVRGQPIPTDSAFFQVPDDLGPRLPRSCQFQIQLAGVFVRHGP
jgi:hypothetical protein